MARQQPRLTFAATALLAALLSEQGPAAAMRSDSSDASAEDAAAGGAAGGGGASGASPASSDAWMTAAQQRAELAALEARRDARRAALPTAEERVAAEENRRAEWKRAAAARRRAAEEAAWLTLPATTFQVSKEGLQFAVHSGALLRHPPGAEGGAVTDPARFVESVADYLQPCSSTSFDDELKSIDVAETSDGSAWTYRTLVEWEWTPSDSAWPLDGGTYEQTGRIKFAGTMQGGELQIFGDKPCGGRAAYFS